MSSSIAWPRIKCAPSADAPGTGGGSRTSSSFLASTTKSSSSSSSSSIIRAATHAGWTQTSRPSGARINGEGLREGVLGRLFHNELAPVLTASVRRRRGDGVVLVGVAGHAELPLISIAHERHADGASPTSLVQQRPAAQQLLADGRRRRVPSFRVARLPFCDHNILAVGLRGFDGPPGPRARG